MRDRPESYPQSVSVLDQPTIPQADLPITHVVTAVHDQSEFTAEYTRSAEPSSLSSEVQALAARAALSDAPPPLLNSTADEPPRPEQPAEEPARYSPPEVTADDVEAPADERRADSGGTGNIPPHDGPPTTFAEPPEEGDEPVSPQAGGTPPISPEAEALRRQAESLGVTLTPEAAERVSGVIRAPESRPLSERGAVLAEHAIRWGVNMRDEDIEAATQVLYVEDSGPERLVVPIPEHSLRTDSPTEITEAAHSVPTIEAENIGGMHDIASLRTVGLQRLRSGDVPEPPEIASARRRVNKEANYQLGETLWGVTGQEVTDLIPEHMRILRSLGDMLVNRAVSNHGIALEASSLGVSATVPEIRERLLAAIGDKLPPGINYVRPDVPMLTEGLTVGTRLDEFGALVGISRGVVSARTGIDLPRLNNFMASAVAYYLEPDAVQSIMRALEIPNTIAGPLLRVYNWERRQRERERP